MTSWHIFNSCLGEIAVRIHGFAQEPGVKLNIYNGLSSYDLKIVTLTSDVINMPVIYAKQMR